MPDIGEFLDTFLGEGGLRGGVTRKMQLQRALEHERTNAELGTWLGLLKDESVLPEARPEILNRYFDTLATLGDKKTRKELQPAQDFLGAMMQKAYPGREAKPQEEGGIHSGQGEPGSVIEQATRFQLPPIPEQPARLGPFQTPMELAQQKGDMQAGVAEQEEAARQRIRAPYEAAEREAEHVNRIAEIHATAEGRTIRGRPMQDPADDSNPWDWVEPQYHGDGTTTYVPAEAPAYINQKLFAAKALAKQNAGMSLNEAWDAVNIQSYDTGEQLQAGRDRVAEQSTERLSIAEQSLQLRKQAASVRQRISQGIMTPGEARQRINNVASIATRRMGDVLDPINKKDPKTGKTPTYAEVLDAVSRDLFGVPIQQLRSAAAANPYAGGGAGSGRVAAPSANPY
jgi:hypothetical protein